MRAGQQAVDTATNDGEASSTTPLLLSSGGPSTPAAERDGSIPDQSGMSSTTELCSSPDEEEAPRYTRTSTHSTGRTPPSSRRSSRASSPVPSEATADDELPSNVCTEEQLDRLPAECLSGEADRPLRHVDEMGRVSHYALRPMFYSVIFILLVELLERFSFYGINYTQTSYLTGVYNDDWNAGMDAIPASSYVAISVAVAYTTPFIGAILADTLLGEYASIMVGILVFYLPGLFLVALTSIPGLLGNEFNHAALKTGLLFLWPVGTGIVKSIVNVFGAKQFHPLLQSSQIESYYVKFYMCINIGALVGGIAVPVVAQRNVVTAYFLPVLMLTLGASVFMMGSSRYIRGKPKGSLFPKKRRGTSSYTIGLDVILRVTLLVVPFNIAYSQMATTFIVQGTVMKKAFGFIDAPSMNNADAISVLLFGSIIGNLFYPFLANRGIKIPTTYKFAIGSALGALAIVWALLVEHKINATYEATGRQVNICWQALSYVLIGAGEIFAASTAYEVAFSAAPPEKKVLASAVNLFCIGSLPNVICLVLYHVCKPWFENARGTTSITRLEDYTSAHVGRYFLLLFLISVLGVVVNLLPIVRKFVESVEDKAVDMMKSPKTPSRPPRREGRLDEESPLLRIKRHHAYMKYGSGPTLYKQGSMRAGPALMNRKSKSHRHLKRSMIPKLYRSEPTMPPVASLVSGISGKPIPAGVLLRHPSSQDEEAMRPLERSNSN